MLLCDRPRAPRRVRPNDGRDRQTRRLAPRVLLSDSVGRRRPTLPDGRERGAAPLHGAVQDRARRGAVALGGAASGPGMDGPLPQDVLTLRPLFAPRRYRDMRTLRIVLALGLVGAVAVVAVAASRGDAPAPTIKIRGLFDHTGPFSAAGAPHCWRGAQMIIDYVNERGGGLGKYRIVQVDGDSPSKAEV